MADPVVAAVVADLRSVAQRRRFGAGEVVFRQGDRPDGLYVVATGKVAIQVSNPDGDMLTLAVRGPGDTFGELALVTPHRRSATVVTLEPCEIDLVDRVRFRQLRGSDPRIEQMLVAVLAAEVLRLSNRVVDMFHLPADVRVVRALDELAGLYGSAEQGKLDRTVRVPMTQNELAAISGTTRQTCNRVLGTLAEHGIVERRRGAIHVVDMAELAARAR